MISLCYNCISKLQNITGKKDNTMDQIVQALVNFIEQIKAMIEKLVASFRDFNDKN